MAHLPFNLAFVAIHDLILTYNSYVPCLFKNNDFRRWELKPPTPRITNQKYRIRLSHGEQGYQSSLNLANYILYVGPQI